MKLAGAGASLASSINELYELRSFRRAIDEAILVLLLLLHKKIAEGVDVVTKSLSQLAPYGSNFCYDRIIESVVHSASSSSGVHTIGGS